MPIHRQLRGLVPAEVGVVMLAAFAPVPIPVVIPLLVAASLSLWVRGRSWLDVARGPIIYALIGLATGALGLGLALGVGTPLVERATSDVVQWSMYPIVRGSPSAFAMVAILACVSAVAAELVLRGWLVERVLELRGPPIVAVMLGAITEALLVFPIGGGPAGPFGMDGDLSARIGAGVFGLALGWMYVAGGRSVIGPLCARIAFSLGALALEAARLVG